MVYGTVTATVVVEYVERVVELLVAVGTVTVTVLVDSVVLVVELLVVVVTVTVVVNSVVIVIELLLADGTLTAIVVVDFPGGGSGKEYSNLFILSSLPICPPLWLTF